MSNDQWWREAVIYQVYPRSFADGDGDGVGDLRGIRDRLHYLADLGVDAVWLSPFYRSPQADAGYDVSDHCDVDPLFGTLSDIDALIEEAHTLGVRVIVDVVPNHTSDQHPWFRAALAASPGSRERSRYIFRPSGPDGGPPNNWCSVFGGPAWTRLPGEDDQWYLHLFDTTQPDLDWTNPEVHAEMQRVLTFWLDRGVDGFRIDVARGLVKAEGLPDFPPELQHSPGDTPAGRTPLFDQPGVHEVYRQWRQLLSSYGPERILVAEAHVEPPTRLAQYVRPDEMHQAFNFEFLDTALDATAWRRVIEESYTAYGAVGAAPTWVLNNHDDVRHTSRYGMPEGVSAEGGIRPDGPRPDLTLGARRARAASLAMLALPGCAYVYQGEELGLEEVVEIPDGERQDPTFARTAGTIPGRDGCRVPIPWTIEGGSFGFSDSGASWITQPGHWGALSVQAQGGDERSSLTMYRRALAMRRRRGLGGAQLRWREDLCTAEVLAFEVDDLLVVLNLSDRELGVGGRYRSAIGSDGPCAPASVPPTSTVWFERTPASATSV